MGYQSEMNYCIPKKALPKNVAIWSLNTSLRGQEIVPPLPPHTNDSKRRWLIKKGVSRISFLAPKGDIFFSSPGRSGNSTG
jgi:hypothetical protein